MKYLTGTIMGTVLLSVAVPSAHAATLKTAKCSDIGSNTNFLTPQYLAVVDGYNNAGKKVVEEVDMDEMVSTGSQMKESCAKDPSQKLADVQKASAKPATKTGTPFNALKAKCSDFVALGTDVQPVAAFWVAGHGKEGKLKKGEFDEEFLARPVVTLVEDCKAHPTLSFYDRAKRWVKKHI